MQTVEQIFHDEAGLQRPSYGGTNRERKGKEKKTPISESRTLLESNAGRKGELHALQAAFALRNRYLGYKPLAKLDDPNDTGRGRVAYPISCV